MPMRISRRHFLKTALGGTLGLGLTAVGGAAYATHIEPEWVEVTRVTVPLRGLPPAFVGFTLAQISDLHLGAWMTLDRLLNAIAQVNALAPDVIAVTGDFVSRLWSGTPGEITRALAALRPREGVAAVLGNHDHWTHAPTVRRAILASGAWLLDNHHVALRRGDETLYLAGVDDIWEAQHDLDAALRGVPPDGAAILLAHEPDYADEVAATGRVALQLSGHSHGGQVRLPGHGALILPWLGRKYDMGLYDVSGMALYVNRGLGMENPAVRFNCRPEITLLTLARRDQG